MASEEVGQRRHRLRCFGYESSVEVQQAQVPAKLFQRLGDRKVTNLADLIFGGSDTNSVDNMAKEFNRGLTKHRLVRVDGDAVIIESLEQLSQYMVTGQQGMVLIIRWQRGLREMYRGLLLVQVTGGERVVAEAQVQASSVGTASAVDTGRNTTQDRPRSGQGRPEVCGAQSGSGFRSGDFLCIVSPERHAEGF